jgi:hypothetical protein
VSDSRDWQSPGAADDGTPPTFGAPVPPVGSPQPNIPPQQGWTPPPKPGLIPLRPIDFGTLLGAAFRVLRRNPRPTFGTALLVQGVMYLITVVVIAAVTYFSFARLASAGTTNYDEVLAGSIGTIAIAAIIPVLLTIVASSLLQGILVLDVTRETLGEKPRLRALLSRARGRIWALIGWTLLVVAAVIVATVIVGGLLTVLAVILAGPVAGILFGILVLLALIALGVWLGTKLSLVPSVLMAERVSLGTAIARSWALTEQAFWKTFGIQLLVAAMIGIATQIVTTPISFIGALITGLADPNAQSTATAVVGVIVLYLVVGIVSVVFGAIGAVVQSATVALIYIDLRMRKEGLDLELARFVEARQAGVTDLPDPYAQRISRATLTQDTRSQNTSTPETSTPRTSTPNTQSPPPNDSPWA